MAARLWDSQLIAFEESGHSLFLEETHKFNTELVKFSKETNKIRILETEKSVFKAAY